MCSADGNCVKVGEQKISFETCANSHKKINGKTTIINLVLLHKQADDIFKSLIKL